MEFTVVTGSSRDVHSILQPRARSWRLGAWIASAAMVAAVTVAAPGTAFAAVDPAAAEAAAVDTVTDTVSEAESADAATATSDPLRYDCIDSWEPRTLVVPDNVVAYEVVATAGSGSHGHNDAEGGVGALVTGTLNVDGIAALDLWVGCGAYDFDGAGYGHRGGGGSGGGGTGGAWDGGDGGGASMIAVSSPFTPLIAAGGGGGSGGDEGRNEGGKGGSGGGVNHTEWPYDGGEGSNDGADGGKANSHTANGQPSPNGGGGGDGSLLSGGGGGGGAGYPSGGGGGHQSSGYPGGGGGAGGSFLSSQRVTDGNITIATGYGSGRILLTPVFETTTSLTVTKVVSGAAGSYATGPFTVDVACTLNGAPSLTKTIALMPGGSHTFPGVVSDTSCTVTETGTGGASTPAPPQTVTIGASPTTVTVTNAFAAGSFEVSVTSEILGEGGAPNPGVELTLGDLGVHVSCTLAGQPIVLPSPVSGGHLTFTGDDTWSAGGQTLTVAGVPVNSECAVVQAAGSGATTVGYAIDGTPVAGEQASFTVGDSTTSVHVTDVYQLAPLSITKAADGNEVPPSGGSYSGTVSCTFQGEQVTLPASAVFDVAVGGTTVVHGLPVGAHCTVTETGAGSAVGTTYSPSRTVLIAADPVPAVTITNTFDSGALLVSLSASGAGAAWASGPVWLSVRCGIGDTGFTWTGQVPTLDWWNTFPVDGGSECRVIEGPLPGGVDSVWYASSADQTPSADPVRVTVPADGTATLTVDNVFTAAPLEVSTTTIGAGSAYASRPTTVTVSDCTFNGEPIEITPGVASVALTLPAHGGTASVPVLPTGAVCSVAQTDGAGATSTSSSTVNAEPVSELPGGSQRVTVNQPADGTPTSVAFANQFDVAALTVSKVVAGDAAWAANAPYEMTVSCTFLGEPVLRLGAAGTGVLQFEADGTLVASQVAESLKTLSVGSECFAAESAAGGATAVGYQPADAAGTQSGLVTLAGDGALIVVTNTFGATDLTVSKVVAGNDAANHAGDVFHFDTSCTFNGKLLPAPPSDPDRSEVFTLTDGGSRVFAGLPVGAVCDVNEFGNQHATDVVPSGDQEVTLASDAATLTFTNVFEVAPVTVNEVLTGAGAETFGAGQVFAAQVECVRPNEFTERVVLPNGGDVELSAANDFAATVNAPVGTTCSVAQGLQLATHQGLPEPVTVVVGERQALPIVSAFLVEPVAVSKTAHGEFSPRQEFGFEARCVWTHEDAVVGVPLNEHAPGAFTLRAGQQHSVEALVGAECTVTETDAGGAIRTVVDVDGTDTHITGKTATFTIGSGAATHIAFTNYLPGALPVTGTEASVALGAALLLLLGGAVLFFLRRRRQA